MDEPTFEPTPTTAEPDGPVGGWNAPPSRTGREKVVVLIVAVLAIAMVGAFVGGFVFSFLAEPNASSPALASMFGRPYAQLPTDFHSEIETRIKAIEPADFEKRTDAQQSAWVVEQNVGGLVRLDDATLTRHHRLRVAAWGQMPVAACAAGMNGGSMSDATAFLTALSVDQRKDWIEIFVESMEAQARDTPVPRTVVEDETNRVFEELRGLATPEEDKTIRAWTDDPKADGAVICAGVRVLYGVSLRLPAADLATYARYNVQP